MVVIYLHVLSSIDQEDAYFLRMLTSRSLLSYNSSFTDAITSRINDLCDSFLNDMWTMYPFTATEAKFRRKVDILDIMKRAATLYLKLLQEPAVFDIVPVYRMAGFDNNYMQERDLDSDFDNPNIPRLVSLGLTPAVFMKYLFEDRSVVLVKATVISMNAEEVQEALKSGRQSSNEQPDQTAMKRDAEGAKDIK